MVVLMSLTANVKRNEGLIRPCLLLLYLLYNIKIRYILFLTFVY